MYSILFIPNESYSKSKARIELLEQLKKIMTANRFEWISDFLFTGEQKINAVNCVLIIQNLGKQNEDFHLHFKDIKMLRIEENISLIPAI